MSTRENLCTLFEEYQVICHNNQISVYLIAERYSSTEITGHISLSLTDQDNLKITYDFRSNPDVQAPPKKSPERKSWKGNWNNQIQRPKNIRQLQYLQKKLGSLKVTFWPLYREPIYCRPIL